MLRAFIIFTALFIVSPVYASNFNFLHQATPISDFNEQDLEMFKQALRTALNEKKDGERLAWKNEKTGSSGLVNPLLTLEDKCRNARIINKSKNNIAESRYKFCKKDGKWLAVEILEKQEGR